jgi:hypothetical protein
MTGLLNNFAKRAWIRAIGRKIKVPRIIPIS